MDFSAKENMFNQIERFFTQEELTMALMDKVKGILGIPEDADEMYDDDAIMTEEGSEDLSE